MRSRIFILASALVVAARISPLAASNHEGDIERRTPACPSVIVYGVRGSSDNPTTSVDPSYYSVLPAAFTQIANAAIKKAGGGELQPIAYPASRPKVANGTNYKPSVAKGIASLQDTIYNFIDQCATGRIIVLGFSQGAQVVSSALAGSTDRGPLMPNERVTAVAIFGDPAFHDFFHPIDQGSGARNGVNGTVPGDGSKYNFINQNYPTRVRSYCQAGDIACDSGTATDAFTIHTTAPAHFEAKAKAFIKKLL